MIAATLKPDLDSLVALGDYTFSADEKFLFIRLPWPGGQTEVQALRIVRTASEAEGGERPRWVWDGDRAHPTLSPSLHLPGVWHGWLRAGQLVE